MAVIEVEGKTVDEAIEIACRELNAPREKLEIEVLSAGSTGIFGIVGTKKAKIRASLREEKKEKEEKKEEEEKTEKEEKGEKEEKAERQRKRKKKTRKSPGRSRK